MKLALLLTALFWALLVNGKLLSQHEAQRRLSAAGIPTRSTGGCTARANPRCTSLQGIRDTTVKGAITLKKACGCSVIITAGTEAGHPSGKYSHWNGYKFDFAKSAGLNKYITRTFTRISNTAGGSRRYKARSGNIYVDEGNHWDVTFYTDGTLS